MNDSEIRNFIIGLDSIFLQAEERGGRLRGAKQGFPFRTLCLKKGTTRLNNSEVAAKLKLSVPLSRSLPESA